MNRLHPSFFDAPIAHRGLHDKDQGVIENSISAIRNAVVQGYGIEIDVQPADDMTPMVFHDYLLERLTNAKGPIRSKTPSELASIQLSGSEDSIPTLTQVLGEIDQKVPLLIEIKDQDMRLGDKVGDFQNKVCDVVRGYDGPIAIMSFSPETMARVIGRLPEMPVGLVTDPFKEEDWPNVPESRRVELAQIPDAERLRLDFISHQQKDLASPIVAKQKDNGLAVFCWTIRSAGDEARARKVADNVTFEGYAPAS